MHRTIRRVSFSRLAMRRAIGLALLGLAGWLNTGTLSAQITVPTDYKSYAIMGGSTVLLDTYSTVNGDVYSAGNTTVKFGYGIQRSGTSGNFYSGGNWIAEGTLSDFTGNVAANGSVSVASGVDVIGKVQYGTTYTGGGNVTGTITQVSNSVPALALPTPRMFTAGTNTVASSSNLVLAPGSYGDINLSSSFYNTLTLSSGDYFVGSLTGGTSGLRTLNLNLTNGPIRFYSTGDINLSNYLDVVVNGVTMSTSISNFQPEARLASAVIFQTNGNFTLEGGGISSFFGTIHAPNGTVNVTSGNRYGTIIAGGAITAEGYQYKQSYNFNNEALGVLKQSGTAPQVIVGGTVAVNGQLANLAAAGGGSLDYSATPTGTTAGLSFTSVTHTGTLAPGANIGMAFNVTGTTSGTKILTVGVNTPGALDANSSASLLVNVLDHASASFSTSPGVRVMQGSTANGAAFIRNASGTRAGLQVTNPGSLLDIAANTIIAPGSSVTARGALNTSTLGPTSSTYPIQVSDNQTIAGATPLPDLNVVVAGSILDNRRVTTQGTVDLGIVHSGVAVTGNATLVTTGADNSYTRITVNNTSAADTNGISTTGSTAFRFGLDGMSSTRALSGTPNKTGALSGTLTLTTNAEAGVTGTQTLANVTVPYTVKVFTGKSTWNGSVADSWGTHNNWTDNLSDAGAGSPGISAVAGDTATFGNVIGNQAANIALNGANPSLANITFDNNLGGSYTISGGTGGALTIAASAANPAISVTNGNHRITTPITLTTSRIIGVDNAASTLTIDGSVTSTSGITKNGAGTLVFTAVTNSVGPITINAGTVRGSLANLNNTITNNGALILDQPTNTTYTGTISGTGAITKTGNGRITLTGIDQFSANAPLTISGGALNAPVGLPRSGVPISLEGSGTLEAAFSVTRAISGTGSIVALDDLTLGRSSQPGQFNLGGAAGVGGSLQVGSRAVVILSSDAAVLGSQTSLADQGSLTTINGARLGNASSVDATKVLSAVANSTINGNFINNGLVNGPTTLAEWLTFTQDVTGAGSTTGNIRYAGSYSPGNSPAVVAVENIAFDPTSVLTMEIGGSTAGLFDQLIVSGTATLDGTLDLSMLSGYEFELGKQYPLIVGNYTGSFDQTIGLTGDWHLQYSASGVSVVPEPGTMFVVGLGIALGGWRLVRRRNESNG